MIYLIVSITFAIMATVFSLERLMKNRLEKIKDSEIAKNNINSFIHFLNSAAILMVAWQCLKLLP